MRRIFSRSNWISNILFLNKKNGKEKFEKKENGNAKLSGLFSTVTDKKVFNQISRIWKYLI